MRRALWHSTIGSQLHTGAAALLRTFGAPVREFIERRLGLVFTLFVLLLAGGFFLVKYL